jgi:hypothetical protein
LTTIKDVHLYGVVKKAVVVPTLPFHSGLVATLQRVNAYDGFTPEGGNGGSCELANDQGITGTRVPTARPKGDLFSVRRIAVRGIESLCSIRSSLEIRLLRNAT